MLNTGRSVFSRNRETMAPKVRLKVPSGIKNIKKVSSRILKDLEPYNISEDKIFDIRLCVDEAVRNAMVHGNKSDKRLSVTTTYSIDDEKIEIEVADEGRGFDHRNLPDPTSDDNILRNSGRGVLIIQKLMDRADYNETGNAIKMVKYLKSKGD